MLRVGQYRQFSVKIVLRDVYRTPTIHTLIVGMVSVDKSAKQQPVYEQRDLRSKYRLFGY
jgi:hypothetical protein